MKYVILLGDGMADRPLPELQGKTPLQAARTPHMDRIAAEGTLGLIDTIPAGLTPGSDVANLSVLGYDPTVYHTGRGPLEAASMGVPLAPDDVAFRCNLVTFDETGETVMEDFTAGHISSEEARRIVEDLDAQLSLPEITFYPGVGYRHLMVYRGGSTALETTPPHDITGRPIAGYLPKGKGSDQIGHLMERSRAILKDHPVNRERMAEGKKTADSIWLWGEGGAPAMKPLTARYGIRGGIISAVDLLKGIGVYAGLDVLPVEGATGYTDTNYRGKAERALEYLRNGDFVFLHVEAPDEMGHEGDTEGKIRAIEDFDEKVVGTILAGIGALGDFRVMVLSDHPTPIELKTHSSDPSPFAVLSSVGGENAGTGNSYSEASAEDTGIVVSPGHLLMDWFMKDWRGFIEEKG